MSKFIDRIEAQMTNRKFCRTDYPLLDVTREVLPNNMFIQQYCEYKIGVSYGSYIQCIPEEVPQAKMNIVCALKEEIYSDIRLLFLQLQRAYWDRNNKEVEETINEIYKEIF